jgi:hypothetical protein
VKRLAALGGAVLALAASPARADEAAADPPDPKAECAAAYEMSQEKRKAGELIAAREQLRICVRDACPGFVRSECTAWLEEVETSLPSVVLEARRGDQDLVDVRVSLDGKPIADTLSGSAVALDPGSHVFRFETEGEEPVERRVLVRVGEKNRRVAVSFAEPETAPVPGPAQVDPGPKGLDKRTVSYVLGGVGALALGSFVLFAVTGSSDENDLERRCKPNCPESDVDAVRTKYLIADVSLGVGLVALGAGSYFFVSSLKDRKQPQVGVAVQPTRGGAFLGVSRRF